MNVQQLIRLGLTLLMAHPVWGGAGLSLRGPISRPLSLPHIALAPAAAAAAAAPAATPKPVAAQILLPLPGQTVTTLPDGQLLTLGGQGAAGALSRAALRARHHRRGSPTSRNDA